MILFFIQISIKFVSVIGCLFYQHHNKTSTICYNMLPQTLMVKIYRQIAIICTTLNIERVVFRIPMNTKFYAVNILNFISVTLCVQHQCFHTEMQNQKKEKNVCCALVYVQIVLIARIKFILKRYRTHDEHHHYHHHHSLICVLFHTHFVISHKRDNIRRHIPLLLYISSGRQLRFVMQKFLERF